MFGVVYSLISMNGNCEYFPKSERQRLIATAFLRDLAARLLIVLFVTAVLVSHAFPQQTSVLQEMEDPFVLGVVVEKVAPQGEGEKAGLREGDILLTWSRDQKHGKIQSPFDLGMIETEEEPRGRVTLGGRRGVQNFEWRMGYDSWRVEVRPNFSSELLPAYDVSQKQAKTGKADEIAKRWQDLAAQYSSYQAPWLPAWLLFHSAELLRSLKQWKESDDAYKKAIESAIGAGPEVEGKLLQSWAQAYLQRSDWLDAETYFHEALDTQKKLATESFTAAEIFDSLARLSLVRGNPAEAEQYVRQALDMREKLDPESIVVAASLNNLGYLANTFQGNLEAAEQYFREALEIGEKQAPGSLNVFSSLNNLGIIASERGDLAKAEAYYSQALNIREKLDPGHSPGVLSNLGDVAYQRGDLVKAERYYRQALEIQEKLEPENLGARALFLHHLGFVVFERGDFVEAEEYDRRSLDIRERLAPESLGSAESFSSLGDLSYERGDLTKAERYYRQALDIREKLAPESLTVAESLSGLGLVASGRGDLVRAEEYYRHALDIEDKFAPESASAADTLRGLGDVARKSLDLRKAERYARQALAIRDKLAPGSVEHAEVLADLASILRDQQQLDSAAQFYEQSVNALESQTARLGGSQEVRSDFRVKHSDIYRDYVDLLVAQKKSDRAFEVLEQSRARTLLETLATARVDIHKGADPSLLQQERSLQESIAAKSDRRLHLLGDKTKQEQLVALNKEIDDLEKQYQETEEWLRERSPHYAELTQSQALTASEIQRLLDPDTLLLEFSLGEKRSYLFAVTPDSVTCHELAKRAEIQSRAKHLHDLAAARSHLIKSETVRARQRRIQKAEADLPRAASALSRVLLGPVASDLGHKRLAIVADGALQYVPFAALPVPRYSDQAAGTYVPLIKEHEILELPSASVLATLRKERMSRPPAPKQVAVFADPVFDAADVRVRRASGVKTKVVANATATESDLARQLTRSVIDLGLARDGALHLPRLLFSRREADAIMESTPQGMGFKAIDFEANRKLAISGELSHYRIVHFATHALVDDQHPELSGLVLSRVDEQGHYQEGFFDLRDVYNLELAADLVVLSACDTALGKQVDSEGMIGLTRGFMYAGASAVLGTKWKVNDFATSKFMKAFYAAMEQDGMTPAQALRQAQLTMLQEPRWSPPFYWAGFMYQGDWK